jgi:hypothetical protein
MTKRGGLAMRRLANVDSTAFVMVSTIAFMESEEGTKAMAKLTLVSGSDDLPAISFFPGKILGLWSQRLSSEECVITCYECKGMTILIDR